MKVLLHDKYAKDIKALVKKLGFDIVTNNPDVVISYGGDGTLLSSERHYPGIPKLPIRNDTICNKCSEHQTDTFLKRLLENSLPLKQHGKLETTIENHTILALNDFVIRNKEAVHAIRFQVTLPASSLQKQGSINNKLLIGDGVVLATPLGSTAYFKSITGETFDETLPASRQGFGVAFNNTTQKINPIFLKKGDQVTFKLIRGHAGLTYDNSHSRYAIKENTELTFKLSDQVAKIYEASSLRCPNCQVIRG